MFSFVIKFDFVLKSERILTTYTFIKLKKQICKNTTLLLKTHTLTIIGILGILINEVEKINFVNWNSGQMGFGVNLRARKMK